MRKVDNTELDDPHEIEVGEENGHTAWFVYKYNCKRVLILFET